MNDSTGTTKNGLLNIDCASIISKERRTEINQLATQAFKAKNTAPTQEDDYISYLKCECYSLSDVLGGLMDITPQARFYKDIDSAFELLIAIDPKAFATYQALTGLFRVVEKESNVIEDKYSDAMAILHDLDLFEAEEMKSYLSKQ